MITVKENMDSDTRKTPMCKAQQRLIGSAMRKVKHDEIKINHGHFFSSGFLRRGNVIVYFSTSDFRYFPNEAYARFAESFEDYHGSANHNSTLEKLDGLVDNLLTHSEYINQ